MCAPFPVARQRSLTPTQAQGQLKLSSIGLYWRNTAGGKEVNVNAAGTCGGSNKHRCCASNCSAAPRRSASRVRLLRTLGLCTCPRGLAAVLCNAFAAHSLPPAETLFALTCFAPRAPRADLTALTWTRIPGSYQLSLSQQARGAALGASRQC